MNDWTKIRYFKPSEFAMKGDPASGLLMNMDFVFMLDELRHRCGFPLIINSGYRSKAYNAHIGGSENSMHLEGRAADIRIHGERAFILVEKALRVGFRGIGINQKGNLGSRFIHLDNRANKTIWSY